MVTCVNERNERQVGRNRLVALDERLAADEVEHIANRVADRLPVLLDAVADARLSELLNFIACADVEKRQACLEDEVTLKGEAMTIQVCENLLHLVIRLVPCRAE